MPSEPAASREVAVATTVAFTEGPTVAEDGTVYFTDLGNNRIMRLSTDGQLSTFRQPSHRANGLIFDSEWRLLACESGDGDTVLPRVTRTNMETGEIEVIADDIVVIGQGRVVAQGTKEELLHDDRTLVRAAEVGALAAALQGRAAEGFVLANGPVSG